MNDDALLYSKHNSLQKVDANYIVSKYSREINWQKNANVLDVGCADGTVTLEALLPKLTPNFNKLVLMDISETMVKFARDKIKDPRIEAVQMDISSSAVVENFEKYFDHIFSFYCLQQTVGEKHLKAFQNIFEILKPGGDFLSTLIRSSPVYKIFKNLCENEKWAPYSGNYPLSPYLLVQHPVEKLRNLAEKVGFVVHECKEEERRFIHSSLSDFLGLLSSIIPFTKLLPGTELVKYMADLEKEARECSMVTFETDEDGNERVIDCYKILVIRASKPM